MRRHQRQDVRLEATEARLKMDAAVATLLAAVATIWEQYGQRTFSPWYLEEIGGLREQLVD